MEAATDAPRPDFPRWRFRIGAAVFVLAWLSPLGVPLVAATGLSTAAKAMLSGFLLVGLPEILTVAAIAVLGGDGFDYLKARAMALLRRYAPPREVGRTRYYTGLVMLFLPGMYGWSILYLPDQVPGYADHRIPIAVALDLVFFGSFFVLGGDFWDKVRALFVYRARARFPDRVGA